MLMQLPSKTVIAAVLITLSAGAVAAQTVYRRLKDEPATCVLHPNGSGFCDGTFHRFRHSGSDRQDVIFEQLPAGTRGYGGLSATKLFFFRFDNGVPLIEGACFVPERWMLDNPETAPNVASVLTPDDFKLDLAGMWPQTLNFTGRFRITWDARRVCTNLVLINGASARDNY